MTEQPKLSYADSLRLLADWYDANPDMPPIYDPTVLRFAKENEDMARKVAHAFGTFKKTADDAFIRLTKTFGTLPLQFIFYRRRICTPRVVGTKTEIVKRPAVNVPMIEVEETREIIEWVCPPLLAPAEETV